ncbi:MAG: PP2C family protein-serine/threonine phosphatase [Planctomycetota bacterium]|jgi:serine phosphatase RsbU (regulator of sigma subunit)
MGPRAGHPTPRQDEPPEVRSANAVAPIAFGAALLLLGAADLVRAWVTIPDTLSEAHPERVRLRLAGMVLGLLATAGWLVWYRGRLRSRTRVAQAGGYLLILVGTILIASRIVLQPAVADPAIWAAWGLLDLAILHFTACILLPVTPREGAIPFAPVLLVWAAAILVPQSSGWDILDRVVAVIVSPVILVPGTLVAGWKTRRRIEDLERLRLRGQVKTIGGELSRARIVHDAMFPRPCDDGHVCFEYEYVPIAEIGGDYVHYHMSEDAGEVCLTLLDVAGHGLAAALTVNRLFGELERIRAEDPDATPADIMALLNRYIYLTMAPHSLFATGACFMLELGTGQLRWVNAGHPPALLRRSNGSVVDIPGTTILLGAEPPEAFEPNQQTLRLVPGDVVIAYTDGLFEARNRAGERFGIDNLRQTARFNPPPRSWTKFLAHAVASHHEGRADDDVLVASLALRSLRVASLKTDEEPETVDHRVDAGVSG